MWPAKPKILTIGPSTEKFTDPCSASKIIWGPCSHYCPVRRFCRVGWIQRIEPWARSLVASVDLCLGPWVAQGLGSDPTADARVQARACRGSTVAACRCIFNLITESWVRVSSPVISEAVLKVHLQTRHSPVLHKISFQQLLERSYWFWTHENFILADF